MSKNYWGLAAACIGLLMCIFFSSSVTLMLKLDVIEDKLMDLELVTVDDYTAQTRLDPAIYREFLSNNIFGDNDVPIMDFKQVIQSSIKDQLLSEVPESEADIIDIHFGFNNVKLLDKLEERANALKCADFNKLQRVQNEMTKLKNEHLEEFNTPNYMWVTFKHDVAIQAALTLKTFKMGDNTFNLKRAQHPTDIKFENREFTDAGRNKRKILSILCIAIVFGVGFTMLGTWLIKSM